uniref:Uncharacterized protein n=1 Tax=Attheya septentrionalis TaxID=420275 RepID=A0A7S2UKZ2_9STRA|mmetsp:Transcript_29896/g.54780  ORF Transcript_29896/g.54780 Transcript_29896/m.54780 type:complete len:529 (+) Transcript_29896:228-1814(+)
MRLGSFLKITPMRDEYEKQTPMPAIFQELHACLLPDRTTCYSGARRVSGDVARLSTRHFAVKVSLDKTSNNSNNVQLSTRKYTTNLECIAHDSCSDIEVSCCIPTTAKESDTTTATSTSTTNTPSTDHPFPTKDVKSKTDSIENSGATTPPSAYLLVRRHGRSIITATTDVRNLAQPSPLKRNITIPLSYCPLVVRLFTFAGPRALLGIVTASWDGTTAKVRFHSQTHDTFTEITGKSNGVDNWICSSPIMSLDSCIWNNSNYLAVGCQDGTVRILQFCPDGEEQCHSSTTREPNYTGVRIVNLCSFLIDGPIVSLHFFEKTGPSHMLSPKQSDSQLNLAVGSLCGCACLFYSKVKIDAEAKVSFEGPVSIVEDLWNSQLNVEDSVLAVHSCSMDIYSLNPIVCVGTYTGRLFLLSSIHSATPAKGYGGVSKEYEAYQILWQCQLPYPIHGISSPTNSKSGLPQLLVTTGKSLHLFQCSALAVGTFIKTRLQQYIDTYKRELAFQKECETKYQGALYPGVLASLGCKF